MISALMLFALQIPMFALMIARHHFVYDWVDHRYLYYPFPFLMTVLFGLALMLQALVPQLGIMSRRLLQIALALIVVSNLLHLTAYKNLILNSNWFPGVYTQTEILKSSMRNHSPDSRLDKDFSVLFLFYQWQQMDPQQRQREPSN